MRELQFRKEGDLWMAETQCSADYNVHVELNDAGTIIVHQKTSGDKYVVVHIAAGVETMDDDFDGIVWPKSVMITATKSVSNAIITENT